MEQHVIKLQTYGDNYNQPTVAECTNSENIPCVYTHRAAEFESSKTKCNVHNSICVLLELQKCDVLQNIICIYHMT